MRRLDPATDVATRHFSRRNRALALCLLALSLAVVWLGITWSRQQAVEQVEEAQEDAPPSAVKPEDFPMNLGSGASFALDGRPWEIPGLSDMDVIGELQYIPGTTFRCPGGEPTGDGRLSKRTCRSFRPGDPAVYGVTVLADAGATVSVAATASDAPDEEAAGVLGRVAALALADLDPLDPEAWVERTIMSGGQYLGEGAEVRLYGVQGHRTLEIVEVGSPIPTEPRLAGASRPKADQGKLDDVLDEASGKPDSKGGVPGKTTAAPK